MSIHLISIALLLSLAIALILALKVGVPASRKPTASPTIVSSAQAERVVVMPTAGGRLEVATVRVRESFTRSDSRVLLDILDLGTTVSEVRVDATYRFQASAPSETTGPERTPGSLPPLFRSNTL